MPWSKMIIMEELNFHPSAEAMNKAIYASISLQAIMMNCLIS
jgi:hypothetical protein